MTSGWLCAVPPLIGLLIPAIGFGSRLLLPNYYQVFLCYCEHTFKWYYQNWKPSMILLLQASPDTSSLLLLNILGFPEVGCWRTGGEARTLFVYHQARHGAVFQWITERSERGRNATKLPSRFWYISTGLCASLHRMVTLFNQTLKTKLRGRTCRLAMKISCDQRHYSGHRKRRP